MAQPGRRSAAASILPLGPGVMRRLIPPTILTRSEQTLFGEMAAANPHLTQTDAPLLAAYVQALTKMHKLGKKGEVADWGRAGRLALSIATKLRLTPQSTQDPQALGRRRKDAPPPS